MSEDVFAKIRAQRMANKGQPPVPVAEKPAEKVVEQTPSPTPVQQPAASPPQDSKPAEKVVEKAIETSPPLFPQIQQPSTISPTPAAPCLQPPAKRISEFDGTPVKEEEGLGIMI
jgi:hypothetical protein